MKANKQQQQALLSLLGRMYEEIRDVENAFGLQAGPLDFRPRIDYFHDAVRAFSAGESHGHETVGRLTVESLAYDMSLLRQIGANPISRIALPQRLSPGTAVAVHRDTSSAGAKPDSTVRYRLMDLYKHYTVLFVALLAEPCDRNYYSRTSEHDNEVEELAALENMLRESGAGADPTALAAQQVSDPDLRRRLLAQLKGQRKPEAGAQIKTMMKDADKRIAQIDKAHMSFLSSQLTVYEESKDLVKKMMLTGMNIVGDFLGAAMAEAARAGRGR